MAQIRGTTVHPSPRPSHRVPFGTGRSIARTLHGESDAITFYHAHCFRILGDWLKIVAGGLGKDASHLMKEAASVSIHLKEYLETAGFPRTWERLAKNSRGNEPLLTAFHGWFDALATMKLIHHLSAAQFPRCGPEEAVPPLLFMAGLKIPDGIGGWLELLREVQNGARTAQPAQLQPCPVTVSGL